jgi:hypothetical protein
VVRRSRVCTIQTGGEAPSPEPGPWSCLELSFRDVAGASGALTRPAGMNDQPCPSYLNETRIFER